MQRRTLIRGGMAGGLVWSATVAASATVAGPWVDALDAPARLSPLAPHALFNGLACTVQRVVAVGQRGHIVWSDHAGHQWQQAAVPVSTDLLAVSFPSLQLGWAVGHDGVVLHSRDAGRTWVKQLDGRGLQGLLPGHTLDTPLLDVHFDSERSGHAVGAFGLLLRTEDGGRTWRSLTADTDNPDALHLYAVRRVGGVLYVAGEQGLLLRHNTASDRFERVPLPYRGTLFGVMGSAAALLVHGLRGTALRSTDRGVHWQPVATGCQAGLTGGHVDALGRWVLVSQAGHVLLSRDEGSHFQPQTVARPVPAAAVVATTEGRWVVAGPRGLHIFTLT